MSAVLEHVDAVGLDPGEPVLAVFSEIVADIGSRITAEIRQAGQVEAARLQKAIAHMRDSIRQEVAGELREEFEARFHQSMEVAKSEFADKVHSLTASLEREKSELHHEVAAARKQATEVYAELLARRSELEHLNREIASMLEDPDIELSKIMRHKGLVTELSAYVRGLQYLSGEVVTETLTPAASA